MEDPLSTVHPSDFERTASAFREGYEKDHFRVEPFRLRTAGGSYVWIRENVSRMRTEHGPHRFYATCQDVSEEMRLHYELTQRLALEQKLREQADHANHMKSSFLSSVSHDMRTPLNAVLGYTQLALSNHDPDVRQDYLEKIAKAGSILKQLINDTLDLSRIESGKMTLKLEQTTLDEVIQKVLMAVRPGMDEKHLKLVLQEDDSARQNVLIDVLRMQEIVLNILSNAVKFTPEGGRIEVREEQMQMTSSQLQVRLTIQDTGIGMSAEFLRRIYEPFAQERTARTADIEGTGLGLAIVKRIVDVMHGTIWVSSEIDQGTKFELELSLPSVQAQEGGRKQQSADTYADLKGLRILVFEDNTFNAEIAKTLLEQQGASAELVGNGREGTDLFAASAPYRFDAVLMDIRMPVMNGYEAARAIRAMDRPDSLSVPIIAMSADAYEEDIQKSLASGMNDHLAKPIDMESLAAILAKHLKKQKQA
jgi:signal transduction histidine kinase/ActR/RegA family two-component response regulator